MTDTPAVPTPQPAYGGIPAIPDVPAVAPNVAPPSPRQAALRGVIGVLLIFAGLGGQAAGAGFPSNAPVEMFMNFGITVAAVIAGIILVVFAFVALNSRSLPLTRGSVSPLAIAAVIASALAIILWLVVVPGSLLEAAQLDYRLRYGTLSMPAFATGFLWGTGIVMGAISFRSPAFISRVLATLAVMLGFAMIATNIWAAAIYSAGLTD